MSEYYIDLLMFGLLYSIEHYKILIDLNLHYIPKYTFHIKYMKFIRKSF